MIVFEGVTKIFGNGTVALDDVSFTVDEGELVVLQGKSGAGKTTIIRLVLKELLPTEGAIYVDRDNLGKIGKHNIPLLRRKVGVAFQDFKVLSDRTVGENISVALDILDLPEDLVESRTQELLELTGLSGKYDLFPSQLSGGELQRVAIARALAPQPKILFADEPTGNLDKETGLKIVELLKDIHSQGTTVVIATHDPEIITKLHTRVLALDRGKLTGDTKKEKKPHSEKPESKSEEEHKKNGD